LHPQSPNDALVTLKNDHSHAILLILSTLHTAVPAMSILIHAGQSAAVHIPPGKYDMMFSAGRTWCDPRSGFAEGQLLKFGKTLTVRQGKPIQLNMRTSGPGMEDFQLFVKNGHAELNLPPPSYTRDGSMEVQRQPNGRFYLPGTIKGIPFTFMVDPGASVTTISSDLARHAGISNCKEVQFHSANDSSSGCIAFLPRMMLGKFVIKNITVAVVPNLQTNVLGTDVLGNFQIRQNDSSLLVGKR
jgi:clan AA aspartic protease (TIGR02281 family)